MKFFATLIPLLVVGAMASPVLREFRKSMDENYADKDAGREQLGELGRSVRILSLLL